jgi:3-hydroxy-9,10-secoandrosta-1,3,5(10)-triene-9,17-dione monooxygenase
VAVERRNWDDRRELVEAARALLPTLEARSAAANEAGCLPEETFADLKELGVLRLLQPKRFGGLEGPFATFADIAETLSEGCSSTGWVYGVLAEHSWIIACYPERTQQEVWGEDPTAVASSSLAPRSTAKRVPGGWRLSGRYPFSSGCLHAQWAIVGAFCEETDGSKPQRYLLIPMSDITILDDWQVLGLRATGSRTLLLDDVFVPAHRGLLLSDLANGTVPGIDVHPDYPLVRAPRFLLCIHSQVPTAVAVARKAVDFVARSLSERMVRATKRIAESEVVQMSLAQAAAEIDAATLVLHTRRRRASDMVMAGQPVPHEDVITGRRDVVFVHQLVTRAMERLAEIAGTQWVYDDSPLQPMLRDVMATGTHAAVNWQVGMVPYGRMRLGLPPDG